GAGVALASRRIARPAVVHALWVVVLCVLLRPPVIRIGVLPGSGPGVDTAPSVTTAPQRAPDAGRSPSPLPRACPDAIRRAPVRSRESAWQERTPHSIDPPDRRPASPKEAAHPARESISSDAPLSPGGAAEVVLQAALGAADVIAA